MIKVFISWSGNLSKDLAKVIRDWLPMILQYVKPYFTPDDIEKGSQWLSSIESELNVSDIGIICLTRENKQAPWILFEAGALSKKFDKSRVCTVLFGLETTDITGPLTNIQATKFNKEDFKKMIESINNMSEDSKINSDVLNRSFEVLWPKLEEEIEQVFSSYENSENTSLTTRSDNDMLKEILELTRSNSNKLSEIKPEKEFLSVIKTVLLDNARETDFADYLYYSLNKNINNPYTHCFHENKKDFAFVSHNDDENYKDALKKFCYLDNKQKSITLKKSMTLKFSLKELFCFVENCKFCEKCGGLKNEILDKLKQIQSIL